MNEMNEAEFQRQLTEWRHYLHANPESAFEEVHTAEFVASNLKEMGLEVCTGIGKTGIVASMKAGSGDATIGIRADMDAICLAEQGVHTYTSRNSGKMHACGHDGHTATLMGAALLLARQRNFNGTVRFIFQPAEEPGYGARAMIEDGLFSKFPVDEIYGLHNAPFLPAGTIHTCCGGIMASEDDFIIRITGKGGHASSPHQGNDPLASAVEIYQGIQTIVSRSMNPLHPAVISVTEFLTDGAHNAIPTHVELKGDARSCSTQDQMLIESRMRSICEGVSQMNHVECKLSYTHEFYPLCNTARCVDTAVKAARRVVGEERVDGNCEAWMGSEDFAAFLKEVPGCFVFLGSGSSSEPSQNTPLHNAEFDYNDQILITGAKFWAELVRQRLA